jgi:glycerate-2-kinase
VLGVDPRRTLKHALPQKSKGGTIIAGPGAVGDLFVTGPVGAEVNNFRAILAGALPDQA